MSKKEIDANKLIEVRYEDLVHSPLTFFKSLLNRLEIEMSQKFEDHIKSWDIKPVGKENYETTMNREELNLVRKLLNVK